MAFGLAKQEPGDLLGVGRRDGAGVRVVETGEGVQVLEKIEKSAGMRTGLVGVGRGQGLGQGVEFLDVAAGGVVELVRGNQALQSFDDVRAGGRNQDALEVGVASGIVTVGVVPGDFDHAGYSLADARLGSGERVVVAVLGEVGLDAFHREELVETATGRLLLGASQEFCGQFHDVTVFEKELLERVRIFETVFAGQHQQSRDVAAAFRGGNHSGGVGGDDAGAAAGIR